LGAGLTAGSLLSYFINTMARIRMINTGREMDVPDAKAKYLVENNTAILIEVKAEDAAKGDKK